MQVWRSADRTAGGTPEALTIAMQILRSAACTRRALPEAASLQSRSSAFASKLVSVAGVALAIVARQSASCWARLGVAAGATVALVVVDRVEVRELVLVAVEPLWWWAWRT